MNEERTAFSTNSARTVRCLYAKEKKKNVNLNLIFYTNINSKWVTGLTVKPKTMKIFKEQKQRKSPGTNHRGLSLDTKSITCKRKRWWIGPYQP